MFEHGPWHGPSLPKNGHRLLSRVDSENEKARWNCKSQNPVSVGAIGPGQGPTENPFGKRANQSAPTTCTLENCTGFRGAVFTLFVAGGEKTLFVWTLRVDAFHRIHTPFSFTLVTHGGLMYVPSSHRERERGASLAK